MVRWPRWSLLGVGVLTAMAAALRLAGAAGPALGWVVAVIPVLLLARTAGIRGGALGAAAGVAALFVAEVAAGPLPDVQQGWTRFAEGAALYVAFVLGTSAGIAIRDRTWLAASDGGSLLARARRLLPGAKDSKGAARRTASPDDAHGDDLRDRLPELVREAWRPGETLALVLFEVPGLASCGDDVRKAVRDAAADQLTEEHTLLGPDGDRLAALLPGETSGSASVRAERVRANVAPLTSELGSGLLLSAGVAALGSGDTRVPDLLERAESAVARASEFGGDRVIVRDGDAYRAGPVRPAFGRGG